jgi:hypothetical protein
MAKRKRGDRRGDRQEASGSAGIGRTVSRSPSIRGSLARARTRDWTANMEQRAGLEGRQVKCLIASEGHLWMRGYFDRLPGPVRRRLAESRFNICPACMDEEARSVQTKPTVSTYFTVIARIERKLEG